LPLFDDEFRKKLEYLSIISKRVFAGHFRAERRATRRGTGVEFADYRQYVPGDDFRHLDWKAYLRLNKLILRLFEEEEDLPIYFFIDASQSMTYGTPVKLDYARRVAAALAYIGLANLDRAYMTPMRKRFVRNCLLKGERDASSKCSDSLKNSSPAVRLMPANPSRPIARRPGAAASPW